MRLWGWFPAPFLHSKLVCIVNIKKIQNFKDFRNIKKEGNEYFKLNEFDTRFHVLSSENPMGTIT